ncbi:unnamed protein product [Alopecurus aequalis]
MVEQVIFQSREQQQEVVVSSEIQQHINQINMEMNMDDDEPAAAAAQDFSSAVDDLDLLTNSFHAIGGGSFTSSLSCSPEMSSHVLMEPLQFPEVSCLVAAGGLDVFLPYDVQYTPAAMAPDGMPSMSAFRRYERPLGLQRRLTKPACGQRMLKTAMKYSHHHQQEPLASVNPMQHIYSERKRRERLKESFRALKTVLPPGSKPKKLGQTSILSIAREYVLSLKSKVRELEKKNQVLRSELAEDYDNVEIQITRSDDGEVCTVKVAATPVCDNTTDVAIRILQRLKDLMGQDVTLVSMSTGDAPHGASLTLQLKSASGTTWDEEAVRKAVTKAMTISAPGSLCGAE